MNDSGRRIIGPKSMKAKWKLTFQSKGKGIVSAPIHGAPKRTKILEELYNVEEIVQKKMENGVPKYLIKWEGWPSSANTWEPVDHIPIGMVTDFEEQAKADRSLRSIQGQGNIMDENPSGENRSVNGVNDKLQGTEQSNCAMKLGFIQEKDQDNKTHTVPFAKILKDRTVSVIETVTYKSPKNNPSGKQQLIFIVRFEDSESPEAVTAPYANAMFPEKVIEYFESIITFS